MIIDAWIQHPTPKLVSQPFLASLKRWLGVDEVPALPLSFTTDALDAAQIDIALLSAWYGPQGPIISNDEIREMVNAAPDRLLGVAGVDLRDPMSAVRELRERVEQGFRALRMLPWLWNLPPDDRRYYPLYAACVDLGIPFLCQVGHTGPLCPSEPGRPIPYLDRVALDFPELVIVGGHIGFPWTQEMISLSMKYENVYIDTSAYKPSRYPPELVQYLRRHGRRKVLFGSNWPMISPALCMEQLDSLNLDTETRALFLGGNAARIFQLAIE